MYRKANTKDLTWSEAPLFCVCGSPEWIPSADPACVALKYNFLATAAELAAAAAGAAAAGRGTLQ